MSDDKLTAELIEKLSLYETLYSKENDLNKKITILDRIIDLLYKLCSYDKILEYSEEYERIGQLLSNISYIIKSYIEKGSIYFLNNKIDEAINALIKAKDLAETTKSNDMLMMIYNKLSSIYFEAMLFDDFEQITKKALTLSEGLKNNKMTERLKIRYGNYFTMIDINKARKILSEVKNIAGNPSPFYYEAQILFNLSAGNVKQAEKIYRNFNKALAQEGYIQLASLIQHFYPAEFAIYKGDFAFAEENIDKLLNNQPDKNMIINALLRKANLFLYRCQCEKSLKLIDSIPDIPYRIEKEFMKLRNYIKIGEFIQAIQIINNLLEVSSKHNFIYLQTQLLSILAYIYILTNNIDKAKDILESCSFNAHKIKKHIAYLYYIYSFALYDTSTGNYTEAKIKLHELENRLMELSQNVFLFEVLSALLYIHIIERDANQIEKVFLKLSQLSSRFNNLHHTIVCNAFKFSSPHLLRNDETNKIISFIENNIDKCEDVYIKIIIYLQLAGYYLKTKSVNKFIASSTKAVSIVYDIQKKLPIELLTKFLSASYVKMAYHYIKLSSKISNKGEKVSDFTPQSGNIEIVSTPPELVPDSDNTQFPGSEAQFLEFKELIGKSRSIFEIKLLINKVKDIDLPVLITGETGVGKDLVANIIHKYGARGKGPFYALNCATLPKELIESELFGYVKGAFTGASTNKEGLFHAASGGTLFLDEIAEIPIDLQSKLLRVIEEKKVIPLGSTTPKSFNTRIITATNKNLNDMIKRGLFRADLFYRINIFSINIPPLRERKEDILPLIEFFLENITKERNIKIEFTANSIKFLQDYWWPGNVRQLKNVIESLVILSNKNIIDEHFVKKYFTEFVKEEYSSEINFKSLKVIKEEAEKEAILAILRKTGNNISETAKLLGISRQYLHKLLSKYRF